MTREELKQKLRATYAQILQEVENIDEEHWKMPIREDWHHSIHNLISHIVGWDIEALKAAIGFVNGQRPPFEDVEDSTMNTIFMDRYRDFTKKEILLEYKHDRENIFNYLDHITDEEIEQANAKGYVWKKNIEEGEEKFYDDQYKEKNLKMEFHTILDLSYHDLEHLEDIRKFKQAHNIPLAVQAS